MARGDTAKNRVIDKIAEAFGDDFIGYIDKKVYVWENDGGERVQIAISMTCPKTFIDAPVKTTSTARAGFFEDEPVQKAPATISDAEKKNVEDLMKELGLI